MQPSEIEIEHDPGASAGVSEASSGAISDATLSVRQIAGYTLIIKFLLLLVGAFSHGQVGYHRPFRGAGQYRAHLDGLYLCGSSSHPGGNITGLPGYNAAQVILADQGKHRDWV